MIRPLKRGNRLITFSKIYIGILSIPDGVVVMMCNKCMGITGWLFLVFGVLFLLQDVKVWNFWGLNWFTIAFLLYGLTHIASSGCKDCQAIRKK